MADTGASSAALLGWRYHSTRFLRMCPISLFVFQLRVHPTQPLVGPFARERAGALHLPAVLFDGGSAARRSSYWIWPLNILLVDEGERHHFSHNFIISYNIGTIERHMRPLMKPEGL